MAIGTTTNNVKCGTIQVNVGTGYYWSRIMKIFYKEESKLSKYEQCAEAPEYTHTGHFPPLAGIRAEEKLSSDTGNKLHFLYTYSWLLNLNSVIKEHSLIIFTLHTPENVAISSEHDKHCLLPWPPVDHYPVHLLAQSSRPLVSESGRLGCKLWLHRLPAVWFQLILTHPNISLHL